MPDLDKILAERGASYGSFASHAKATQDLKSVLFSHLSNNERYLKLNGPDRAVVSEALEMIARKLGRIVNGDPLFEDSWDDIAGYAKLVPLHTTGAPF